MNEQKEHEATKKCAVYARLDRHEAHSVEEQVATCRAEIQKHGWTLSEHHVFTDAAWYSRVAMDDRPGLKVFSPGIWWIGSSVNLSGSWIQSLHAHRYVGSLARRGEPAGEGASSCQGDGGEYAPARGGARQSCSPS